MKCPKCGYLGFDQVDRCRNCGYEFSLVPDTPLPELAIRPADLEAGHPLDDLALIDAATAPHPPGEPATAPAPAPSTGLPLFGGHDGPMITRPSPPRAPLAVRRSTPDAPRPRFAAPRTPLLDLSGITPSAGHGPMPSAAALDGWRSEGGAEPAAVGARAAAAAIDLTILAAIDLAVVYFTVQICGLTWADLDVLPKAPLIAFLLVQNGGYLVAFNAGGQTLGKMAAGIRVVSAAGNRASIDVTHALLRTVVWIVLAVPAGLGFATALLSRERRGLHDQFAGTRVVRATPLA